MKPRSLTRGFFYDPCSPVRSFPTTDKYARILCLQRDICIFFIWLLLAVLFSFLR